MSKLRREDAIDNPLSLSSRSLRERAISAAKADKTYLRPPRSTEAIYWIERGVHAALDEVASDFEEFVCPNGHRFWLDRDSARAHACWQAVAKEFKQSPAERVRYWREWQEREEALHR